RGANPYESLALRAPGIQPRPPERDGRAAEPRRALQDVGHDRAVHRGAGAEGHVAPSSDPDRLHPRLEPAPGPAVKVARGVRGIGLFEIEVLHVRLETRQAPGNPR